MWRVCIPIVSLGSSNDHDGAVIVAVAGENSPSSCAEEGHLKEPLTINLREVIRNSPDDGSFGLTIKSIVETTDEKRKRHDTD